MFADTSAMIAARACCCLYRGGTLPCKGLKRTSQKHISVWFLLKVNASLVDTIPEEIMCSAGTASDCMTLNAWCGTSPCLTMSMPQQAVTCQPIATAAAIWQTGPETPCCHWQRP